MQTTQTAPTVGGHKLLTVYQELKSGRLAQSIETDERAIHRAIEASNFLVNFMEREFQLHVPLKRNEAIAVSHDKIEEMFSDYNDERHFYRAGIESASNHVTTNHVEYYKKMLRTMDDVEQAVREQIQSTMQPVKWLLLRNSIVKRTYDRKTAEQLILDLLFPLNGEAIGALELRQDRRPTEHLLLNEYISDELRLLTDSDTTLSGQVIVGIIDRLTNMRRRHDYKMKRYAQRIQNGEYSLVYHKFLTEYDTILAKARQDFLIRFSNQD